MEGLTEGRIVHYVPNDYEGFRYQEHRPAIVVKLWEKGGGILGCVQLQVFIDGSNDLVGLAGTPAVWRTSVLYNADGKPGTWHWIERS